MKKIKPFSERNKIPNKNINLSKILNSDLFFQSSGTIKMALNKNRLLNRDFGIKRAKPKIDLGKKNQKNINQNKKETKKRKTKEEETNDNNNIYSLNRKKEIPFELADIIENNQIKFEKTFEAFHDIKSKNDIFTSHWHYVQKSNDKIKNKEKKISFNDNKKEEFYKTFKKYDFSTRDKIELELQKKLTTKIFKSNPLMIKSNNDMLFYYLSMCKDKNLIFKEQNPTKYLNKIKEILDYMEIFVDCKNDKVNKDIDSENSNFLIKRKKKIDEENIKLKEEQQKKNIIDNIESKKMIGKTKRSLKLLNKNKNYFEDPNYFSNNYNMSSTFYKNNSINYLTPNKKNIMSKSSSDFFIGDKHHFNNFNNFNNTLKILQEKKFNLSKKLSSLLNRSENKEETIENQNKNINLKKYYSLLDINNNKNKISSLLNNIYKDSSSKDNSLKYKTRNKNKLKNIKIINKNNSLDIRNEKNNINNLKILPSIKQTPHGQTIVSPQGMTFYPKNSDISNIFKKNVYKSVNIRTNKNDNDSSRLSVNKSLLNESYNENKIQNERKKNFIKLEKNVSKLVLSELYDKLKDGRNLNKNNLKNIYNYIHHKKLKNKKKKDTMNLIKDVQLLSDGFDINKVSKSIENIPNKEIKQIRNFKKINLELNKLDKKYVKDICEFKAKNQRNDGEEDY